MSITNLIDFIEEWKLKNVKYDTDKVSSKNDSNKLLCVNGLPHLTFVQMVGDNNTPSISLPTKEVVRDTPFVNKFYIRNASYGVSYRIKDTCEIGYGFVSNFDPEYCIVKVNGKVSDSPKFLPKYLDNKNVVKLIRNPNYRNLSSCIIETYQNSYMSLIEDINDVTEWFCEEIPELNAYNFVTKRYKELITRHQTMKHSTINEFTDDCTKNFTKHLLHINVELGHYYATYKSNIKYNPHNPKDINCYTEYVPIFYKFRNIPSILSESEFKEAYFKLFPNSGPESFIIKQAIDRDPYNKLLLDNKDSESSWFITRNDVKILLDNNAPQTSNYNKCVVYSKQDISNNVGLQSEFNLCDTYDYRQFNTRIINYLLNSEFLDCSVIDYTEELHYSILTTGIKISDTVHNNHIGIKVSFGKYNSSPTEVLNLKFKQSKRNYATEGKGYDKLYYTQRCYVEGYYESDRGYLYNSLVIEQPLTEDTEDVNSGVINAPVLKSKNKERIIVNADYDVKYLDATEIIKNNNIPSKIEIRSLDLNTINARSFAEVCKINRIERLGNQSTDYRTIYTNDEDFKIEPTNFNNLNEAWDNWKESLKP
jgi:hypothetical protein